MSITNTYTHTALLY